MSRESERRERARRRRRERMCRWSIFALLVLVVLVAAIASRGMETAKPEDPEAPAWTEPVQMTAKIPNTAIVIPLAEVAEPEPDPEPEQEEGEDPLEAEKIEAALLEKGYFREDVPLSFEEQDILHVACEQAGIPYALALAVIEKETGFRNVMGDDGASAGYMQVQQRWHQDRMDRLGVTDLLDPFGNFKVGCDFLAELLRNYGTTEKALTVYNNGHYPGYTTKYAKATMALYERWKELVGDDVSGIAG